MCSCHPVPSRAREPQVIVPRITMCYNDTEDAPEKFVPMCTLKNFPVSLKGETSTHCTAFVFSDATQIEILLDILIH